MDHAIADRARRRRYIGRLALLTMVAAIAAGAYAVGYSIGDAPHDGTAAFCVASSPAEREESDIPLVSFNPSSDACPSELIVCGYLIDEVRYLRDIEPSSFRSERCPFRFPDHVRDDIDSIGHAP